MKTRVDMESFAVIAAEDIVHDVPDFIEPHISDDIPDDLTFPQDLKVLCEEDIVGQRAFIVYESSLMQLVNYMQLP